MTHERHETQAPQLQQTLSDLVTEALENAFAREG